MKKLNGNQSQQAIGQVFIKLDKIEKLLLKKSDQESGGKRYLGNQLRVVFEYLASHTATASMISAATGIPQKNICRYKRQLEKAGLIYQVDRAFCEQTGHVAWYLSAFPGKKLRHYGQTQLF